MMSWMTLVNPKDLILKVLCHYLYFWLRYMGVNKASNQRPVYSHVTKYWPLIGRNFNPRYWGGARVLWYFFTSIHSWGPVNWFSERKLDGPMGQTFVEIELILVQCHILMWPNEWSVLISKLDIWHQRTQYLTPIAKIHGNWCKDP